MAEDVGYAERLDARGRLTVVGGHRRSGRTGDGRGPAAQAVEAAGRAV